MKPERWIRGSVRCYRWLVRGYPRAFRRRFGAEMEDCFRNLCWDAWRSGGFPALAALWLRTLRDLAGTLPAEGVAEVTGRGYSARVMSQEVVLARSALLLSAVWGCGLIVTSAWLSHLPAVRYLVSGVTPFLTLVTGLSARRTTMLQVQSAIGFLVLSVLVAGAMRPDATAQILTLQTTVAGLIASLIAVLTAKCRDRGARVR